MRVILNGFKTIFVAEFTQHVILSLYYIIYILATHSIKKSRKEYWVN